MERVSSATTTEVEDSLDAISTDQSGVQGKTGLKFGLMLTQKSLMELRRCVQVLQALVVFCVRERDNSLE
jgi:hypothetical protein